MRTRQLAATLLSIAIAIGLAIGSPGWSKKKKSSDVIPVDEIVPGMKGHGITVFSGRDPERFDVEVISVIHDFLPRQDLILARCSHPVTDHAGVIAGMSGSPIYFDDRLAGAVAYAWRFSKDPIAGITPATSMNEILEIEELPLGTGSGLGKLGPGIAASPAVAAPAAYWDRFDPASAQIVPLATPVSGSGPLWSTFSKALGPVMESHFMVPTMAIPAGTSGVSPVAGKSKGKAKATGSTGKGVFRPGDAIAVQLVGGDLDMAGTGTVTSVEGSRALGFGHPMFSWGQVRMPAYTAIIHHCLASSAFSFKMSESDLPAGTVVQDRQAGILADMDEDPPIVDLDVHLVDGSRGMEQDWHLEVAHHPQLTAGLVRAALTSAVDHFALEVVDTVVAGSYRIEVASQEPLVFDEKVFLELGTLSLGYSQRLGETLSLLMGNEFEDVKLEAIEVDIELEYGYDAASIVGAWASADEVEEGDEVTIWVELQPHRDPPMTLSFDLVVPAGSAGQKLSIHLKPGGKVPVEVAPPESLEDLVHNLALGHPGDHLGAVIHWPGAGVTVAGQHIHELPVSALSTLQTEASYHGHQPLPNVDVILLSTPYMLAGEVRLTLQVEPA